MLEDVKVVDDNMVEKMSVLLNPFNLEVVESYTDENTERNIDANNHCNHIPYNKTFKQPASVEKYLYDAIVEFIGRQIMKYDDDIRYCEIYTSDFIVKSVKSAINIIVAILQSLHISNYFKSNIPTDVNGRLGMHIKWLRSFIDVLSISVLQTRDDGVYELCVSYGKKSVHDDKLFIDGIIRCEVLVPIIGKYDQRTNKKMYDAGEAIYRCCIGDLYTRKATEEEIKDKEYLSQTVYNYNQVTELLDSFEHDIIINIYNLITCEQNKHCSCCKMNYDYKNEFNYIHCDRNGVYSEMINYNYIFNKMIESNRLEISRKNQNEINRMLLFIFNQNEVGVFDRYSNISRCAVEHTLASEDYITQINNDVKNHD